MAEESNGYVGLFVSGKIPRKTFTELEDTIGSIMASKNAENVVIRFYAGHKNIELVRFSKNEHRCVKCLNEADENEADEIEADENEADEVENETGDNWDAVEQETNFNLKRAEENKADENEADKVQKETSEPKVEKEKPKNRSPTKAEKLVKCEDLLRQIKDKIEQMGDTEIADISDFLKCQEELNNSTNLNWINDKCYILNNTRHHHRRKVQYFFIFLLTF